MGGEIGVGVGGSDYITSSIRRTPAFADVSGRREVCHKVASVGWGGGLGEKKTEAIRTNRADSSVNATQGAHCLTMGWEASVGALKEGEVASVASAGKSK